jgi:hypothetical protein
MKLIYETRCKKSVYNFIHNSRLADKGLQAFFNKLFTPYAHSAVDNEKLVRRFEAML